MLRKNSKSHEYEWWRDIFWIDKNTSKEILICLECVPSIKMASVSICLCAGLVFVGRVQKRKCDLLMMKMRKICEGIFYCVETLKNMRHFSLFQLEFFSCFRHDEMWPWLNWRILMESIFHHTKVKASFLRFHIVISRMLSFHWNYYEKCLQESLEKYPFMKSILIFDKAILVSGYLSV